MSWKKRLFSNFTVRTILGAFGERTGSGYSKTPGGFVPYFQYKIGPYESDLFLYFLKEPFSLRYKNEIFNKLNEYSGYDIIRYLEFHYAAYEDKQDFLRFLYYELSERLKRSPKKRGLISAMSWVAEKKEESQKSETKDLRSEIRNGVQDILRSQPTASPQEIDQRIAEFSKKLEEHLGRVMSEAERGVMDLTGAFTAGRVKLNNRNHKEKVIQALILLSQVRAPRETAKGEKLFEKFDNIDVAAILHLHFQGFGDGKFGTVQGWVGDQVEIIKPDHPKVKRLADALEGFFY